MGRLLLSKRIAPAVDVLLNELDVFFRRPKWLPLHWERIADGCVERVESGCVQIGPLLYVICGYRTLDDPLSAIDVLDLRSGRWIERIEVPGFIAQTHCGVVSDGTRYIYFVSGQVGIQCSPAVVDCHSFDLQEIVWGPVPPLPEARYAPATLLWDGRIHVIAGSQEDRVTPAHEHWSLAVEHGSAKEARWRAEPSIPLGGPHRSSAVVGNGLYVLGSQHFDRPPIPGDPKYTCDWQAREEGFFKDCFVFLKHEGKWERVKDMPVAATHTESSTFVLGRKIVVLGGFTPRRMLSDLIQVYDTEKDAWSIVGRMPWRNKGLVHGYYDSRLYVIAGQKNRSRFDATFGAVIREGFRARFKLGTDS